MLFNLDPSKQSIDIFFPHKTRQIKLPLFVFDGTKVQLAYSQKHLVLILDFKLDFKEHIDNKINKCNKIIGIMKRLL